MKDKMFDYYKAALSGEITDPLCADYKNEWRKCGDDKESLVKLAMRQQSIPHLVTFAYQGKGLTKDYIKEEFGDYINGYKIKDADNIEGYTYGLYVDWDYGNDLVASMDVLSIMWTVGANVVVPKVLCPTIYVSNRSKIHLVCEGFNTINVKVFDESEVTIEDCDKTCEVLVYKYSDKAKVVQGKYCLGHVNIHQKELRL